MSRLVCAGLLMSFTGCGWNAPHPLDAPYDAGAPYEIVLSFADSEPDQPPGIEHDSLVVRVRYAGECNPHEFSLHEHVRRDTTVLHLHHDALGDGCEAYVTDELRLGLSEGARSASVVFLRHPEGGPPFRVR